MIKNLQKQDQNVLAAQEENVLAWETILENLKKSFGKDIYLDRLVFQASRTSLAIGNACTEPPPGVFCAKATTTISPD